MTASMPAPLERSETPAPVKARLESLDLFRGIAILAVVGIHISGHASRIPDLSTGSLEAIQTVNRLLQFAVPGFLFMTALVFAYQYRSTPLEPGRFYARRLRTVVQPYLVWSVLYAVFTVLATPLTFANLLEPGRWLDWILTGKAFFHLYFMVIVIQFYVLFPLLLPLFRERTGAGERSSALRGLGLLLGIVALQLGFYWLNRRFLRLPQIGTVVFWHMVPLGLGLLVGSRLPAWPALWTRARGPLLALLVLASVWHLPLALAALRKVPVDTFFAALSGWLYSGTVALLLLGGCTVLERRFSPSKPPFYRILLLLGSFSLHIYLMHPAVMKALEWAGKRGLGGWNTLTGHLGVYLLAVLIPLGLGWLIRGTRLSSVLFGR